MTTTTEDEDKHAAYVVNYNAQGHAQGHPDEAYVAAYVAAEANLVYTSAYNHFLAVIADPILSADESGGAYARAYAATTMASRAATKSHAALSAARAKEKAR